MDIVNGYLRVTLLIAVIDGDEIVYRDYIDVSCAVATPKVSGGSGDD